MRIAVSTVTNNLHVLSFIACPFEGESVKSTGTSLVERIINRARSALVDEVSLGPMWFFARYRPPITYARPFGNRERIALLGRVTGARKTCLRSIC